MPENQKKLKESKEIQIWEEIRVTTYQLLKPIFFLDFGYFGDIERFSCQNEGLENTQSVFKHFFEKKICTLEFDFRPFQISKVFLFLSVIHFYFLSEIGLFIKLWHIDIIKTIFPSRKIMEFLHVASSREGKIFDKTWKIRRACIKIFLQNIHVTCKNSQNFKVFYDNKHVKEFYILKPIPEFYKILRKIPKGNSIFLRNIFHFLPKNRSLHLAAQSNSLSYNAKRRIDTVNYYRT